MSKKTPFAVMALCLILALTSCKHTDPPYRVILTECTNALLPNLHSYTHATYQDKIVLFGGRVRGLHSSGYAFSQVSYNNRIYVVDTHGWDTNSANWTVHSRPDTLTVFADTVTTRPSPFLNIGLFRANNAEFFTEDTTLYVIGGLLGQANPANPGANPITLPYFTAVNLGSLVRAVTNNTTMPAGDINQVTDTVFAVTGGEIGVMDNVVYMTFGWMYNGNALDYTHLVNTFTFNNSLQAGLSYTLNPVCPTCWDNQQTGSDSGNFRRRDGSMSPMIDPKDGTQSFMYYAGVFKNSNTNFDTPVWIKAGEAKEDTTFHMRSNVYTCMVMPFYSAKYNASYATMLGGMTNSRNAGGPITDGKPRLMDSATAPIIPPDVNQFLSIPFSNQFTTLRIDKNRKITQYLLPDSFPQPAANIIMPTPAIAGITPTVYTPGQAITHNGAEAEIIWTLNKNFFTPNGVIKYDTLVANHDTVMVGYIFGGIQSIVDNTNMASGTQQDVQTMASNRLFAIKVIPYPKPWWQFW